MRIRKIEIKQFKSINDKVEICIPGNTPVVLIGDNNSGKSNIMSAIELALGNESPNNFQPPPMHYCWDNNCSNSPIEICIEWNNCLNAPKTIFLQNIKRTIWRYDNSKNKCTRQAFSDSGEEIQDFDKISKKLPKIIYLKSLSNLYAHLYKNKNDNYRIPFETLIYYFRSAIDDCSYSSNLDKINESKDFITELRNQIPQLNEFLKEWEQVEKEMHLNVAGKIAMSMLPETDNRRIASSIKFDPAVDGVQKYFQEIGTGQENILLTIFALLIAKHFYKNSIVLIEEPEIHLNPNNQEWLADTIIKYAKQDNIQIFVSTHSSSFLDLMSLENAVIVRKERKTTIIKQLTAQ